MSHEAMKLALEALEEITDEVFSPYDNKLGEAIIALREALAEQPYEIGTRLAREGKGISDLWGAVKSDADMAEAQRGYEAALAEQPAQQEPVKYEFQVPDGTWHPFLDKKHYENTVKDGSWPIRALYTSPQPAQRTWVGLTPEELDEMFSKTLKGKKLVNWVAQAIEAKLRSKNNG